MVTEAAALERPSCPTMSPRAGDVKEFVRKLTGSKETSMCWRLLPEAEAEKVRVAAIETSERVSRGDPKFCLKRNFDGTVDDVWEEMVAHQKQGWGVFCVVNEGGCKGSDIKRVRALFIDSDSRALSTVEWHEEPSFLVQRNKTHWHAYWRVDGCSIQDAPSIQKRLAKHYGTDPAVSDLPRVMRVPGTWHWKDASSPCLVSFKAVRDDWDRPTLTELLSGLPNLVEEVRRDVPYTSNPVPVDQLRKLLSWIDPQCARDDWIKIIAGIGSTPLSEDGGGSLRREIAIEWSRGKLDRQNRYAGTLPSLFKNDDDVCRTFDSMPPKEGGVGFGTIVMAARQAGYTGPPIKQSAAETFGSFVEARIADAKAPTIAAKFLSTEADIFAWPDPEPLVEGFIMCGENVCLYGQPKVGKTFIALDIGLSITANLPVFGRLPVRRSGPVVYLSGEGHAGIKRRLKAWRQARGILPTAKLPFYYKPEVPSTAAGIAECNRYIEGVRVQLGGEPVLVVIDTMARSMTGLNENDAGDVGRYLALTEGLRAGFNCPILTLAHSGKDEGRGIRGSNASTAGLGAVWAADMNAANKTVKIEARWLKDAEDLGPFCFRLKSVEVEGMTNGKGAVLEYVALDEYKSAATTNDPLAPSAVAAALVRLKAFGRENGRPTSMLVEDLLPRADTDRDDVYHDRIRSAAKTLSHRASGNCKTELSVSTFAHKGEGPGRSTLWYLPDDPKPMLQS